jgi:hypothetical protein
MLSRAGHQRRIHSASSRPPRAAAWVPQGVKEPQRGGSKEEDFMHTATALTVTIIPTDQAAGPAGKLADAELHFHDGPLAGMKLIGFAVWERRNATGRNVTFPARQYSVNGERRSFALLRPATDQASQEQVRELILQAYAEHPR